MSNLVVKDDVYVFSSGKGKPLIGRTFSSHRAAKAASEQFCKTLFPQVPGVFPGGCVILSLAGNRGGDRWEKIGTDRLKV